jgi:hypothetical protein
MASTTCSFRKTKSGEWVASGPTRLISAGSTCTVNLANGGTKTVAIARVGKPFTVNGIETVYGYITADSAASTPTKSKSGTGGLCDECDRPSKTRIECRDSSGITGLCCRRCASQDSYMRSFA